MTLMLSVSVLSGGGRSCKPWPRKLSKLVSTFLRLTPSSGEGRYPGRHAWHCPAFAQLSVSAAAACHTKEKTAPESATPVGQVRAEG